jgi:deoxyhypusine synthase
MVHETLRDMNEAIAELGNESFEPRGLGALLGKKLAHMKAPYRSQSILYNAFELNVPVTVHVAIGTDTIHMSPKVDPHSLGEATFNDFQALAYEISNLEGGVYLNLGSAVILPEVFLKALTIARNLGNKVRNFTTVNMDMLQHYRPHQNVLSRPGGKAFALTGHHEIMVPLLYQALMESL